MPDAPNGTTGLLHALLAVQGEATTLPKDRTVTVKTKQGGEYSYSYTPLDTIVEQIGPLLAKNGLVWSTQPSNTPTGEPSLKYTLAHVDGESIDGEMLLVIEGDRKEDVQALGSAITYARRYALSAVLNLVADADDDGHGAGGGQSAQDQNVCPQCGAAAIIKGKAEYGGGWVCFKKKGGCGAKFATDPAEPPPEPSHVEKVKALVRRHNVKAGELRTMLRGLGVDVPDGGNIVTFVEALQPDQAQQLAEFIQGNPIPTGTSDVPADASGFTHRPLGPGEAHDSPFSELLPDGSPGEPPRPETLEDLAERTLPPEAEVPS